MKTDRKLRQLQEVAELIRDRDLSRLTRASKQKAQTESLLRVLDKAQPVTGLDPIVAARVGDRFGLWTTNRRILLNQQLARESVTWMAAKNDAKRSLGRADVLKKLAKRA